MPALATPIRSRYVTELLPCVLYMFFNSVFLPDGLYYTTLLTPVFLAYLTYREYGRQVFYFTLVSLILFAVHYFHGIHLRYYVISWGLVLSCFVFSLTAYQFLLQSRYLEKIYSRLLYLNFFFMLVAIAVLYIPQLSGIFWFRNHFTEGVDSFSRLKLFSAEASHYAMLFTPVSLYYLMKVLKRQTPHKGFLIVLATLPLLLSLSFGVLASLLLTFMAMSVLHHDRIPSYKRLYGSAAFGAVVIIGLSALCFYSFPDNAISTRLHNILNNHDTSFRGRTYESLMLGYHMAHQKSLWFGMGPGQMKVYGWELYERFYGMAYDPDLLVRIPNAVGETLATYGITGLLVRFGLLGYLYFKTKVYTNYYRQALFIFMFVYQFTGSYIVSVNEYVIWALAFASVQFQEFNRASLFTPNPQSPRS